MPSANYFLSTPQASAFPFSPFDNRSEQANKPVFNGSTFYHYLQVYDWLKRVHPAWLAQKAKGFIPSLTGASALMWI